MNTDTDDKADFATLPIERASDAFKRGFRDARDGRAAPDLIAGTFNAYDYACGRAAAWAEHRANLARHTRQFLADVHGPAEPPPEPPAPPAADPDPDPYGFAALEALDSLDTRRTRHRGALDDADAPGFDGGDVATDNRPAAGRPTFPCERCAGSGVYTFGFRNPQRGTCRACHGRGHFQSSAADRRQNRAKAAARKADKARQGALDFEAAHPGLRAFLVDAGTWSQFARELADRLATTGALSPNQIAAAERMREKVHAARAAKAQTEAAARAERTVAVDLAAIHAMFDTAKAKGLKAPQYRAEGVRLALAGPGSRNPGALYVYDATHGNYIGKVADGTFHGTRESGDQHRDALAAIAANPLEAAKRYGRLTGRCAICARVLTDPESVERAIGPVCAANMGL